MAYNGLGTEVRMSCAQRPGTRSTLKTNTSQTQIWRNKNWNTVKLKHLSTTHTQTQTWSTIETLSKTQKWVQNSKLCKTQNCAKLKNECAKTAKTLMQPQHETHTKNNTKKQTHTHTHTHTHKPHTHTHTKQTHTHTHTCTWTWNRRDTQNTEHREESNEEGSGWEPSHR